MIRSFLLFTILTLILSISLYAKEPPETYTIKGKISDAQKATYDHWVKSVINAFDAIGPGRKLDFAPTIFISEKKNAWPYQYTFYNETFFSCQQVKITKDSLSFAPIKEIMSLDNNEYAFKQMIANHIITNNFGKNIPYWFEKGFSSYIANKAGASDWIGRNYSFLIFLSSEKKETRTIEQILNFKNKFDNKDRYFQEAYTWALIDWLMIQKEYKESSNLILALSSAKNIQSFTNVKNMNNSWVSYLESNYWNHLPKEIKVSADCQTVLDEEDLRGLFFTIKKANAIISPDNIAVMIGYTIHPTTFANIKAMVKDIRPIVRELSVKTLGLIPDRTSLPALIESSYGDIAETVRYESAKSISRLNYQIAPKDLVNSIGLEDPVSVGQVAMALANIGDPAPAKNLIQKLGSMRPVTSHIAITQTRNYVSDYNVVDGVLDPVISTYTEGIVSEVTVLWVLELRTNIMSALNKMPLNQQGLTEEVWYKWYAAQ